MKKQWFSLVVCILLVGISYASVTANQSDDLNTPEQPETPETLRQVLLTIADAPQVASEFMHQGYDVLEGTITESSFEIILSPISLQHLQTQGFTIEVLAEGRPFREIQLERQSMNPLLPAGYLDYPEIVEELYEWEEGYPSICKVYDLTTLYGLPTTYENRHMYALKISDNVAQDEDEPNFLMVGAHHAREVVTPVICNYSIMKFLTLYGTDPAVTNAVDTYEIWISPIWNPDGYSYMYNYDNMWRKNRNPPDGVDQNRNYPFGWYSSGSGSTDPYSDTYKGPAPASESETKTMLTLKNDRHFAKILDYHSYGRYVLYAYLSLNHPFDNFLQSEASRLSTAVGYGGSTSEPSADGENYQTYLAYNGSYSNLIETSTTFQPTYASALSEAAMVWPGTLWMLQRPISISGHVTDKTTGAPLIANITLEDVTFQNGEYYQSEPRFGRYHLFLPSGTYNVNFSAPDHEPQTHQVTVTLDSAEILEIELKGFNDPPYSPTIAGPTDGFAAVQYEYRFSTTDPNNDTLEYFVNWGDGTGSPWLGPYTSGQEGTASHQWNRSGSYQVKVKARDTFGEESQYSTSLVIHITAFKRSLVFGLITEKNETGDVITFKTKFLIIPPRVYHSGETIMITQNNKLGIVRDKFIFGLFETAVLSTAPSPHPLYERLTPMRTH